MKRYSLMLIPLFLLTLPIACARPDTSPNVAVAKKPQSDFAPALLHKPIGQAPDYTAGPGPHRMVILDDAGTESEMNSELPEAWRASAVEDGELVVVVKPGHVDDMVVSTTSDVEISGEGHMFAKQHYLDVEVVRAKTGRTLCETRIFGGSPTYARTREIEANKWVIEPVHGTQVSSKRLQTFLSHFAKGWAIQQITPKDKNDKRRSNEVYFSPDSKRLLVASGDELSSWETLTHKMHWRIIIPDSQIGRKQVLPDGKAVISLAYDMSKKLSRLRVHDAETGAVLRLLDPPTDSSFNCVSPKGDLALSISEEKWLQPGVPGDSTLFVVDVNTGAILKRTVFKKRRVFHAEFSDDGRYLTLGESNVGNWALHVWDLTQEQTAVLPRGSTFPVRGNRSVIQDGGVFILDLATRQKIRSFHEVPASNGVLLSPDGRLLVTIGSGKETLHLWAVPDEPDAPNN